MATCHVHEGGGGGYREWGTERGFRECGGGLQRRVGTERGFWEEVQKEGTERGSERGDTERGYRGWWLQRGGYRKGVEGGGGGAQPYLDRGQLQQQQLHHFVQLP